MSAQVGAARVALVTGEEKRVPPPPAHWVCTVEAMPVGQAVDFLAVDEIQLCPHRERDHVFCDGLLHAHGRRETWLLGADSMRPALRTLRPGVTFQRSEPLSKLLSFGACSLKSLSPRNRNAQVAMYQPGEVQSLVATDAIGMELNLDLDRIAFASLVSLNPEQPLRALFGLSR